MHTEFALHVHWLFRSDLMLELVPWLVVCLVQSVICYSIPTTQAFQVHENKAWWCVNLIICSLRLDESDSIHLILCSLVAKVTTCGCWVVTGMEISSLSYLSGYWLCSWTSRLVRWDFTTFRSDVRQLVWFANMNSLIWSLVSLISWCTNRLSFGQDFAFH